MERERAMKAAAEKRREKLGKGKSWERVLLLAACRKREGGGPPYTTPVVSWKKEFGAQNTIIKGDPFLLPFPSFSLSSSTQVSARKLAAALWEFYHYFSITTMYLGLNNHQQTRRHLHRINNKDDHHHGGSADHHEPATATSLKRHITASLMRHNQSTERNHHALQPLSPASYGSSLEMAPYNPAATPDSSIELKGRIGESSHGFKTSTDLLKVLNRIWTLEEQHASNRSLVKALKNELDHARAKIKDMLRDQQANRREIDQLMKQISEDNLGRKNKEQERVDYALQSVRDELEDERKLRKRSESLHRKLARELFEIKVALSTTTKELERERKSSEVLEELCDEFAKGVREYAGQLHSAKQRSDGNWTLMADPHDNLLLHISETWLDERMQVKDKDSQVMNTTHKTFVVEKLRHEIEAFLSARKTGPSPDPNETRFRRRSLESIPEISKASPENYDEQEEIALISGKRKGQITPPSLQMSDIQTTPLETDAKIKKSGEGTSTEINMLQKSDIYDSIKEGSQQRRKAYYDEGQGSNSKTVDRLMSELLLSEEGKGSGSFPHEYAIDKEGSSNNPGLRKNASPVRQWMSSMASSDPIISESSSKMQKPGKDNSLKAKLQEPKTKGQRSRLKILKGSS